MQQSRVPDLFRSARRIALSSYVANGAVAALGLLLVTVLVHLFLGPDAAAAASGLGVDPATLRQPWLALVQPLLEQATLTWPADSRCWGARASSPSSARRGAGAACRCRSR